MVSSLTTRAKMLVKTGIIMFFYKNPYKGHISWGKCCISNCTEPKTKIHLSRCCVTVETYFLLKIMLDFQKFKNNFLVLIKIHVLCKFRGLQDIFHFLKTSFRVQYNLNWIFSSKTQKVIEAGIEEDLGRTDGTASLIYFFL